LSESIHLKHWQIVKDTGPKETLQNIPDSLWKLLTLSSEYERYSEGNWLIRTNVEIKESVSKETVWGLFPFNFCTAYEIYWDGVKIAQNVIIGINKNDEKAGLFNFNLPLPPHLVTGGNHTVILRISNHSNYSSWRWFYGDFLVGPYYTELNNRFISRYQAFFISGILLIPFLFNLFLYIARKRKTEHLLFSLICFIVILDSVTSLFPILIDTPTTFIHWELYAYQIITLLFTVLFPAFFIYSFTFSKKIIGIIILVNLIIYLFFTNLENVFNIMSITVLIISSIITLWALYKRKEGSLIIFIGLIAAWAAYYFDFAFAGLAATMVICTSFSIARQFARKERAAREAQLRSAHLENELLKKNINPHFILNTLTSIIVWLRKDSASAIKLIEALAEEFRMINQISALKQIPIRQEIDLCKAHLKIMSYRKGADYRMETVNIAEEENVPPMIFHTLIENGLTHGYGNKIQGTFTLQRIKNSKCVQYILSNDGDFNSDESSDSSGFGLRYIKSRLEESYQDRWKFLSHRKVQGWETIIEIKDQ
jgi:sensor histidine kinase YesM